MGLDQYAYLARKRERKNAFDIKKDDIIDCEFMYWRKNRYLHGWMENLFNKKCAEAGIVSDVFNCVPMQLTQEDIAHLLFDIKHKGLEEANGFFWGNGDYNDDRMKQDIKFCDDALKAMEDGTTEVFYDCWW